MYAVTKNHKIITDILLFYVILYYKEKGLQSD